MGLRGDTGRELEAPGQPSSPPLFLFPPSPLNFPFHYSRRPPPPNSFKPHGKLVDFFFIRAVPSRPISDLPSLLIFSLRRLQTCLRPSAPGLHSWRAQRARARTALCGPWVLRRPPGSCANPSGSPLPPNPPLRSRMGLAPQLCRQSCFLCSLPVPQPEPREEEKGRQGKSMRTGKHDQTRRDAPPGRRRLCYPLPHLSSQGGMSVNPFPSLSFLICSHILLKEEAL